MALMHQLEMGLQTAALQLKTLVVLASSDESIAWTSRRASSYLKAWLASEPLQVAGDCKPAASDPAGCAVTFKMIGQLGLLVIHTVI